MFVRNMHRVIIAISLITPLLLLSACEDASRQIKLKAAEVIGNLAERKLDSDVAGGFHRIPIAINKIDDEIFQATGVANAQMIVTSSGNVIYDTGLSTQAAKQRKLLRTESDNDIKYIIISHAHADHVGGTKLWKESNSEIIAHKEFVKNQRYLEDLQDFFWTRNRILFPWIPESPPTLPLISYGGIEPTIVINDDYHFQLGDTNFEVLATPGAEGSDNIVLWLPQKKILFSGDFFGPLFPQFPNIFTMRGEKVRAPMDYIESLNRVIALKPQLIVPSHHHPIAGEANIRQALLLIRDAVQSVHDQTIAGMNAGKNLEQLMREIKLPDHLSLSQEHGKVSWAVKSIWEYYATWFHFNSFTELYPEPVSDIYSDIATFIDNEQLLEKANEYINRGQLVKAIHFIDIADAKEQTDASIQLRLSLYNQLLARAIEEGNNYEKDYLRYLIKQLNTSK